jgi:hypothetical protein
MYNTLLKCTYNNASDVDQEDQYRIEFLNAFNLEEFEDKQINQEVSVLFERVKKSPEFTKCMTKSAAGFGNSEFLHVGLMGLFAFDYFYLAHSCICDFLETGTIAEEKINALLSAL